MTNSPLSILIVSYVFPPYPGIGGRRWTKFAKYFRKQGAPVQVLCARNPLPQQSVWLKDTQGVPVHYFDSTYPQSMLTPPHSVKGKVGYRFQLARRKMQVKGNYYDRAGTDKEVVLQKASELISKTQVTHVIVTGAPFHLLHHCLSLKKKFPNLTLIADIRDPWTSDKTISSFISLDSDRQGEEIRMEEEVARGYDRIYTVAEDLTQEFNLKSKANQTRTLVNGFDTEDALRQSEPAASTRGKINLVFAGTLYNNTDHLVRGLIAGLQRYESLPQSEKEQIILNLAGDIPDKYLTQFNELRGKKYVDVVVHGRLSLDDTQLLISSADYCLLLVARGYEFSFSTKFLEYVMNGKQLLVFSGEGALTNYVSRNGIGKVFNPSHIDKELSEYLCGDAQHRSKSYPTESVKEFDLHSITQELLQDLRTLKPLANTLQP